MTVSVCLGDLVYQRAFHLIVLGQYEAAEALLVRVVRACPTHPYAAELLRLARAQSAHAEVLEERGETPGGAPAAPQRPPLTAPEVPTGLARGELIGFSGLMGLTHGGFFCLMFVSNFGSGPGCSVAGVVVPMFVGSALGAGVAAVASWNGVRPGQAMAIESGTFWGSYNGFMIGLAATDGFRFGMGSVAGAIFETGLALGLGAGIVTAGFARPRAGHIAFLNAGGFWGGAMGFFGWVMSLGNCCSSAVGFAASQLIGVNVGLIAGGIAGGFYPTSRSRMLLVDLGTLLGGALGAGTGTLVSVAVGGGSSFAPLFGGFTMLGIVSGFATTLALTHRIDYPELPRGVRTAFAPVGPDGQPGFSASLTF